MAEQKEKEPGFFEGVLKKYLGGIFFVFLTSLAYYWYVGAKDPIKKAGIDAEREANKYSAKSVRKLEFDKALCGGQYNLNLIIGCQDILDDDPNLKSSDGLPVLIALVKCSQSFRFPIEADSAKFVSFLDHYLFYEGININLPDTTGISAITLNVQLTMREEHDEIDFRKEIKRKGFDSRLYLTQKLIEARCDIRDMQSAFTIACMFSSMKYVRLFVEKGILKRMSHEDLNHILDRKFPSDEVKEYISREWDYLH